MPNVNAAIDRKPAIIHETCAALHGESAFLPVAIETILSLVRH